MFTARNKNVTDRVKIYEDLDFVSNYLCSCFFCPLPNFGKREALPLEFSTLQLSSFALISLQASSPLP